MAMIEIQIPDSTAVTQTFETPDLDGTVYRMSLRWNEHLESYMMDLETVDGTRLLMGRPLTVDFDLLDGYRTSVSGLPPGQLIALDVSQLGEDCGQGGIGGRIKLLYVEAS